MVTTVTSYFEGRFLDTAIGLVDLPVNLISTRYIGSPCYHIPARAEALYRWVLVIGSIIYDDLFANFISVWIKLLGIDCITIMPDHDKIPVI